MDDLDELIKKEVLFAPMDDKMAIEDRPIIKALCINIIMTATSAASTALPARVDTASGAC